MNTTRRALRVPAVTFRARGVDEEGPVKAAERPKEIRGRVPAGAAVTVMRGFYETLEVPVDREWMVVGRGRGADLVLAEPTISRSHAAIGYDGDGFFVLDLDSTNGTTVNGERRQRSPLADSDQIQMGRLLLRFRYPG